MVDDSLELARKQKDRYLATLLVWLVAGGLLPFLGPRLSDPLLISLAIGIGVYLTILCMAATWRLCRALDIGRIASALNVLLFPLISLIQAGILLTLYNRRTGEAVLFDFARRPMGDLSRAETDSGCPSLERTPIRRFLGQRSVPVLIAAVVIGSVATIAWFVQSWSAAHVDAEIASFGRWPTPTVAPSELVRVDLSNHGLPMGTVRSAREDSAYGRPEWLYREGSVIDYPSSDKPKVSIWALKYIDRTVAADDFLGLVRFTQKSCGASDSAWREWRGVIRCRHRTAARKVFWNDRWIVDIVVQQRPDAPQRSQLSSVDTVRDALGKRWKEIADR